MGAWIEIFVTKELDYCIIPSRTPRWVRGLKLTHCIEYAFSIMSHPTMGAWIEILVAVLKHSRQYGRTPRWVRGLKSIYGQEEDAEDGVAPHDGCVD